MTAIEGPLLHSKPDKKRSLGGRVGWHLWNLVSFGKLGMVQEKQRDKPLDETANIVILNSLTHGQVLELLRDRYATHPCMGSSIGSDYPYDQNVYLRGP